MKDDGADDNRGETFAWGSVATKFGASQLTNCQPPPSLLSPPFTLVVLSRLLLCRVNVCEIEAQFKSAAGESNKILLIRHPSGGEQFDGEGDADSVYLRCVRRAPSN